MIQRLTGNEHEVATVGSSLAGYFGVFHRLMGGRLRSAASADTRALPLLLVELKESCCQGEHSYLHAQQLLAELGRRPSGANAFPVMKYAQQCCMDIATRLSRALE